MNCHLPFFSTEDLYTLIVPKNDCLVEKCLYICLNMAAPVAVFAMFFGGTGWELVGNWF
jgi:hypothetical protein